MKKKLIISIILIFVLVVALIFGLNMKKDYYLKINSIKVNKDLLTEYTSSLRAETTQYFSNKYNLTDIDDDFWTKEYDGITPNQYLIDKAIFQIEYDYAIFKDCEKIEDLEIVNVDKINENMKKENSKRKLAKENGEVVYGQLEFSFDTYLDYIKNNYVLRHKEYLYKNNILVDDTLKVKEYYNEVKDDYALFKDDKGEYKNYSDVKPKVLYLYKEHIYDEYIKSLIKSENVIKNEELLKTLSTELK